MAIAAAPPKILIRSAKGSDQGYVASTWVFSQRENSMLVDRVFERRTTRVAVAHPPGAIDRIYGWVCYERQPRVTVVHMLYVRSKQRGRGYAKELFQSAVGDRRLPIVLTANDVPEWAQKDRRWTRMTLHEMLNP